MYMYAHQMSIKYTVKSEQLVSLY